MKPDFFHKIVQISSDEVTKSMKKISPFQFLILNIIIALTAGSISYLLTGNSFSVYSQFKQPPFAPAPIVFPIVWTILYILMGIATYLVILSTDKIPVTKAYDPLPDAKKALLLYSISLSLNILWSPVFFRLGWHFGALIILAALWYFVFQTYSAYKKISRTAGILFIPYILWCTYAFYLNFGIVILN